LCGNLKTKNRKEKIATKLRINGLGFFFSSKWTGLKFVSQIFEEEKIIVRISEKSERKGKKAERI
jgi:hypothetical protein